MIAFTPDVLTISIDIGDDGYPGLHQSHADGRMNGKKTDAYKRLRAAVIEAGEEAVGRGWKMIEYDCQFWLMRYCSRNAPRDALNLGQCEANALTVARVWADDRLAKPASLNWCVDLAGPDRVTMTIARMPQVGVQKAAGARPLKPMHPIKRANEMRGGVALRSVAFDLRNALVNGKPLGPEAALKLVRAQRR